MITLTTIEEAFDFIDGFDGEGLTISDPDMIRDRLESNYDVDDTQAQPEIPKREGVRGILNLFTSMTDRAGNCYHAFRYWDAATGYVVEARMTADNGDSITYWLNGGSHDKQHERYSTHRSLMGVRDFERMVKTWPTAGCNGDSLAEYITKQIANPELENRLEHFSVGKSVAFAPAWLADHDLKAMYGKVTRIIQSRAVLKVETELNGTVYNLEVQPRDLATYQRQP